MTASRPIVVGLVQLNTSFSGQVYLPLATGMLQAYAQKNLSHPSNYKFLPHVYEFGKIEDIVDSLVDCDIVGFSAYVWNFKNSLAIAEGLKRRNPNIVIVFGGPHVPDGRKIFQRDKKSEALKHNNSGDKVVFIENFPRGRKSEADKKNSTGNTIFITENFHRAYPFIDLCCHGEGERVFHIILERMVIDGCADKSLIPSISYLDQTGTFHENPRIGRMKSLSGVPSAYLSGVFDPLMNKPQSHTWVAMWETDRGCPFQCTYCDWGGAIEDKLSSFDMDQVSEEVKWFAKNKIPYIYMANANFGIQQRDVEIARELVAAKIDSGYPERMSVQNTKNPKSHSLKALEILEQGGLCRSTVMSFQSLNPATLKAVRRDNMKLDEYHQIQKRLAGQGIFTMTDLILGLPEETYDSIADAISTTISRGQHNRIQFNNLSILPNSEMGNPGYQERYGMETIATVIGNSHGKKNAYISGIEEEQILVIATKTMPRQDWRRTRALCWMTSLLYFGKLLQIPLLVLHEQYGMSYRQLHELFLECAFEDAASYPVLCGIKSFFDKAALDIQEGRQDEFIYSEAWLGVSWPPEEYILIQLCTEAQLGAFYEEANRALLEFSGVQGYAVDPVLLSESIQLNKGLVKLPFQQNDLQITVSSQIWEYYKSVIIGKPIELQPVPVTYVIDRSTERWPTWADWYERVVWYSNKNGAYLYGTKMAGTELAGHH